MRKSLKVAKWEIKRNVKNKSFIISLFLTPLIFVLFATLPFLIQQFQGNSEDHVYQLYVTDELGVWEHENDIPIDDQWNITLNPDDPQATMDILREEDRAVYLVIDQETMESGVIPVYLSPGVNEHILFDLETLRDELRLWQLETMGLTAEEIQFVLSGIQFAPETVQAEVPDGPEGTEEAGTANPLERIIPAAFAGIILFSVVITGMMIFQSASQEKKDKVAEIILSSVTPNDLMQGKIIGYFALGMIQVSVWLGMALPFLQWRFNLPIFQYLFVPETPVLLFFSVAGYLLFAALFVGLGATVEDMSTAGNFQGIIFVIPWLPFMIFAPILSDPEGPIAQFASYFPLTTSGVMLIRLAVLEEWPWIEIGIAAAILVFSIWLFMRLAGKIFKTGILMYGKNATPQEIWKWLRH